MEYRDLGNTEIKVSKLCFGSLTIGPLQKRLPLDDGVRIIEEAVDRGVNFIDTADIYGTYPYIREVIKKHPDLVVATKSYAYDIKTACETLERALRELGRDYVDIFLLHEQEGLLTLKGHREALDYFIKMKEKGLIRAVGISTHHIEAVRVAGIMNEIKVIHPILNHKGLGIVDGSLDEMVKAIKTAYKNGKGIYVMKPLGGGHLIQNFYEAFEFLLSFPYLHSVAVGMQRIEEVCANVDIFEGRIPEEYTMKALRQCKRKLIVQDWCQGCGRCIERCRQGALTINPSGQVIVNMNKCTMCGYCGSVCKELAIKII